MAQTSSVEQLLLPKKGSNHIIIGITKYLVLPSWRNGERQMDDIGHILDAICF
jgi:hypothetical protein